MAFENYDNINNKRVENNNIFSVFENTQKPYISALHTKQQDSVNLNNNLTEEVKTIKTELEKIKSQQGIIGQLWDGFKNLTHIGAGSEKVEKALIKLSKSETTKEEAQKLLENYKDGQKTCLDVFADMVSSIIAVGAFVAAVPSGGMSLATGLGISTALGAGLKTGIKLTDAKLHNKDYDGKNILYDIVTGGVNGLFAPITNGIGSSLTKTIGCKLGLEVTGEALGQGARSTLQSLIVNQSVDVAGGTIGKRALALGAGMAIDGALGGTTDNVARAVLEGEDAEGIAKSGLQGFIGGLIMAPIIGGGFRIASKIGKKLGVKIFKTAKAKAELDIPNTKTDTDLGIPKPKADVEASKPKADVETPKPKTYVEEPKPKADVEASKPNADVEAPKPKTDVEAPKPKADVEAPKPKADVEAPKPKTDVEAPKPKADVSDNIDDALVNHYKNSSDTTATEPKIKESAESKPKTAVNSETSEAELKAKKPVENIEPNTPKIKHYTENEKLKIIKENGINDYQVDYLQALDDEHFANAEALMSRGYKNNIHQAASLNPEEFKNAINLLDKGYQGMDLGLIATLPPEQYARAEQLINKGLKSNFYDILTLDNKSYQNALKLIDKQCSAYFLKDLAKIDSETLERILSMSNYDSTGKELIKTATEEEIKFAKIIMYGQALDKVQYLHNDADSFLNLDFDRLFKAKELLERGTLNTYIIPKLACLDERQFAQAEKILKMPQFSDGTKGVFELAKLEPQEFEKAREILKIKRFSDDGHTTAALASLNEAKYAHAETLFTRENIENYMIPYLADQEEKQFNRIIELLDRNFQTKHLANYTNDINLNILDVVNLSDEEYSRIFQRDLLNKFSHSSVAGLAKIDDNIWNELVNTSLYKQIQNGRHRIFKQFNYFSIKDGERIQQIGELALILKKYAGKNNINELTTREKRTLLKTLIKGNADLFDTEMSQYNYSELIRKIAGDVKLLPASKEEYCSLLPKLVKAIGIDTKPLTKEVKDGFYDTLTSFETKGSRFRTFDFENPNIKLQLEYPRETFIKDINGIISHLSKEEQNIVCDYFGFEFRNINGNKIVINGYPDNLNNGEKMAEINNPALKEIIEKMRPLVKKFSENNPVTIQGEPELSQEINQILKAFPEFLTEIGKKQHKTHDYTLDIHSLKVLQGVINNPKYENLPENDKTALKIAALFHDITKREGIRDIVHPQESAFDVYYMLQKLGLSEDEKLKIYEIVKNHNWLQILNSTKLQNGEPVPISPAEQAKIAKDIAFELRKGNTFEMASILTEADMKAVKRDGKFFKGFESTLEKGNQDISTLVRDLKKSAIPLPQTKIPKATDIILDGNFTKEVTTVAADGSEIKNVIINLEKGLDLSKYGFEKGLTSEDINVLVHALDDETNSEVFRVLGQIDSDALLSSSYINYMQGNYHVFRNQGFILDVDCDDINAGYFRDFGSGCKKDLDLLKENYLFNDSSDQSKFRNYISNLLKQKLGLSDDEYINLYKEISNKSIIEIDKTKPEVAKVMREVFAEMEGGKRAHGRQYNEILVTRPKIQAVFYEGIKSNPNNIPEFLRKYAAENKLPIIYFGE